MVKICFILVLFFGVLFGSEFEDKCVSCHNQNVPELENLYFRYMQIHGSTKRAKIAMKKFLTDPKVEVSIMPPQALERFGLHKKVSPENLDSIIDSYFDKYDIKNRIKIVK